MGAEADESEGHVATMESGVEGEPLVGKPNEDVHHHLVEQTADTCEKVIKVQLINGLQYGLT